MEVCEEVGVRGEASSSISTSTHVSGVIIAAIASFAAQSGRLIHVL